jgi:hypothetical protein
MSADKSLSVYGRHHMSLDCPAHTGHGRQESGTPLVGVYVVDEANGRPPAPHWREEGYAVLNVDYHVGASKACGADDRSQKILGVSTPRFDGRVFVICHGTAADECYIVASIGE